MITTFLSLPRYYLNVLNFLLEQTFTNLPGCKDHGQDLLVKMPTSQSLPCFVLKLFFFPQSFFYFFFFFCSSCFNCAQEMVDHHHHLFLWKNLGWVHRARHYSLASLVPQWNKMISEEVFSFQLISPLLVHTLVGLCWEFRLLRNSSTNVYISQKLRSWNSALCKIALRLD